VTLRDQSSFNPEPRAVPTPDAPPEHGKAPAPVSRDERIESIDVLRGFALLGVLFMNMQSFAMPFSAYMNPTSYGADWPLGLTLWSIGHIVADAKFITIFSMLFGAGIVLMTSRAEARTGRSAGVHYRRMFWLLLFGAAHGTLIWYGDILLSYALCGLIIWLFRRSKPVLLITVAIVLIAIPAMILPMFGGYLDGLQPDEAAEMLKMWSPTAEQLETKLAAYRGGYLDHHPVRVEAWASMFGYIVIFGWRILGIMFLGMAMVKLSVLTAARSSRFYVRLTVAGFGLGLPLSSYSVYFQQTHDWQMRACMGQGAMYNYFGSLFSAFGWTGLVMLLCHASGFAGAKRRLAATGRMAFTNYIMQSLMCTSIFYGHGLGYFGHLDRMTQWGLVVVIAALQLGYSPWWLSRYRFGPLEWLWRSLTYWRRQPMRRDAMA